MGVVLGIHPRTPPFGGLFGPHCSPAISPVLARSIRVINPPVTDGGVGLNTKSWVGCQSVSHNNELKHRPDRARKNRVESHQALSVSECYKIQHTLPDKCTKLDQHFMPSTIISQPLCVQNSTKLFQKWLQAVTHLLISFFRQIVTLMQVRLFCFFNERKTPPPQTFDGAMFNYYFLCNFTSCEKFDLHLKIVP